MWIIVLVQQFLISGSSPNYGTRWGKYHVTEISNFFLFSAVNCSFEGCCSVVGCDSADIRGCCYRMDSYW